jgi:hypothetical protein
MTLLPLFATVVALLCGPLLYALARDRPAVLAFLDGFVLVSIAGLVLLEAVPGAYGEGGVWSLGFLVLGALGPSLVEHGLQRARREAHLATLALAVLGLLLHSLADGAALTPAQDGHAAHGHAREALAIAIVVHSVPVGMVVWWVMAPVFGRVLPMATILLMCAGTLTGWAFGLELGSVLGERAFAWFQALVAGSILHVVFGRPHLDEHSDHREPQAPFEGLGNLVALIGLVALARLDPHDGASITFGSGAGVLLLAAAPLLLIGYAAAGLVAWLRSDGGDGRLRRALRFALLDAVDVSAARVLGLLLVMAVLDPLLQAQGVQISAMLLGVGTIPLWPGGVVVCLFAASLLRRGGRQWLASVFGGSRHVH